MPLIISKCSQQFLKFSVFWQGDAQPPNQPVQRLPAHQKCGRHALIQAATAKIVQKREVVDLVSALPVPLAGPRTPTRVVGCVGRPRALQTSNMVNWEAWDLPMMGAVCIEGYAAE